MLPQVLWRTFSIRSFASVGGMWSYHNFETRNQHGKGVKSEKTISVLEGLRTMFILVLGAFHFMNIHNTKRTATLFSPHVRPVPDWAPQKGDFFDGTSTQTVGLLRCFGSARRTTRPRQDFPDTSFFLFDVLSCLLFCSVGRRMNIV